MDSSKQVMIKNSKQENSIKFACLATAPSSLSTQQDLVNLQLNYWIDAVKEYKIIIENNNPNLYSMIKVVNILGVGLSNLFGINYHKREKNNHVPSLKKLVENSGLEKDAPDLYERFLKLNEFYNDVVKHFIPSKIALAKDLNKVKLKEYMETTRDVWIWVLSKFYHNIPEEQLCHFKITF